MVKFGYTIFFNIPKPLTETEKRKIIKNISQFADDVELEENGVVLCAEKHEKKQK